MEREIDRRRPAVLLFAQSGQNSFGSPTNRPKPRARSWERTLAYIRKKAFAYLVDDHHGDRVVGIACKVLPDNHKLLVASNPAKFYVLLMFAQEAALSSGSQLTHSSHPTAVFTDRH